jgi:hypothetical protein
MDMITTLIATNKGWLVRQAMKLATTAGAALTVWLNKSGLPVEDPLVLGAAFAALATGAVELVLSKLASGIAAR